MDKVTFGMAIASTVLNIYCFRFADPFDISIAYFLKEYLPQLPRNVSIVVPID